MTVNSLHLQRLALLAASLLLAACGTLGGKPAETVAKPAPQEVPARPGGYYLDDGPGDNPPADIDAIPDAVPRAEPPLARANRPYTALGQSYTPMTSYQPYRAQGVATWYGRRYHGNKTSSGEIYDMYGMSAAHPTLPIPSYVRVTNPANGRSVVVRVNDRGPFHKDRLIDLSYAAAYKLRLIEQGSGQVEVEAMDTRALAASKERLSDRAYAKVYQLRTSGASSGAVELAGLNAAASRATPQAPPAVPVAQVTAPAPPVAAAPAEQPAKVAAVAAGSYIQVGAFKRKENAEQLIERLLRQNIAADGEVRNWYNAGVYRVRLGPYATTEDVERVAAQIRQQLGIANLVITRQETP